jgi:hypothetical protein
VQLLRDGLFPGRLGGEFFINFSPVTDGEILMNPRFAIHVNGIDPSRAFDHASRVVGKSRIYCPIMPSNTLTQ